MKKYVFILMSALLLSNSTYAQEDQFTQCRDTEAALSDVSVYIAQGFNSTDLDTSQNAIKQVGKQLDQGESLGKGCKCPAIAQGVKKTREFLKVAAEEKQIEEIQVHFQGAIVSSEEARYEAEKCWRAAAVAMKKE
jgi:hypothetical protein